jgi:hypothetical protein
MRRIIDTMTKPSLLEPDNGLPRGVQGAADPRFSNVIRRFTRLSPGRRFGGGALSVFIDGQPVADVWTGWSDRAGGVRWTAYTGAMVSIRAYCPTTHLWLTISRSSAPTASPTSRSVTCCAIDPACHT